jgi:two-component system, NtrC family, sensor kinase
MTDLLPSTAADIERMEGELQALRAELAARNSEFGERIEHQAATIEVLKTMSASPGDAQPVFDLIARQAAKLCNVQTAAVATFDGTMLHLATQSGFDAAYADAYVSQFPRPVGLDSSMGRAILHRRVDQVEDITTDSGHSFGPVLGRWSVMAVPMLRDGAPLGAITIGRPAAGPFSDSQMALLQTFAEQAVIAITSAATYRELQERTAALAKRNSEYGERIEQQAATIDVLQAMSASPGDPQPVLDLVARRAAELCESRVGLFEFDGTMFRVCAMHGLEPEVISTFLQYFPRPLDRSKTHSFDRAVLERRTIHIPAVGADAAVSTSPLARTLGGQSIVAVPLLRRGEAVGVIGLNGNPSGGAGFSETQIALLQTFAEQAVIAITSAETYRELQERTAALAERNSEYGERIEQQAATIDVLKVMSASPCNAQPVFELIAERARAFCEADGVAVALLDGDRLHLRTHRGYADSSPWAFEARFPLVVNTTTILGRTILMREAVQVPDVRADRGHVASERPAVDMRSVVGVPMLRAGTPIGAIALGRRVPGDFTATQVELLRTFAEQAVIAIGSAETYSELQKRTAALAARNSEYGERIEQQAATIDVLKVMSASPGDARPVFELIVERARSFCGADHSTTALLRDDILHLQAYSGMNAAYGAVYAAQFPRAVDTSTMFGRAILSRDVVQTGNLQADRDHFARHMHTADFHSIVGVPLLREGTPIGAIALGRQAAGGFTDSQVALLQTFAEQAVIAITSAEIYRALQNRTAELTRSVAELQALEEVLRAVNSSLDLETVLVTIISRAVQLSLSDEGTIYEYDPIDQVFVPKAAFGMGDERVALLRDRRIRLGETHLGRSAVLRAPVAVDDVQQDPEIPDAAETLPGIHAVLAVPLLREDTVVGGLVIRRRTEDSFAPHLVTLMQTFAGQAVLAIENARLFQEAGRARTAAEAALVDLRRAQDRLVQSEKMASLGQLTAGIAHEIKNPLNFVNNFSELSRDLLDELNAAVAPDRLAVAADLRTEIDDLTATLKGNLEKVVQHGRRADSIVKNMLLHSRSGPSEHRAVDLNATVEEALNLAYHGARAETPGFNITMKKDLDPTAGLVELYPQEFIRVMLNLINNGFYAARNRANQGAEPDFEPTLWLATRNLGEQVEIRVCDNGTGISETVRGKIFEPFFTTKPAGEGTGLGLSLSYDIVVKQHGGRLTVDSRNDAFTEFQIILPRAMAATDGGQS